MTLKEVLVKGSSFLLVLGFRKNSGPHKRLFPTCYCISDLMSSGHADNPLSKEGYGKDH